MAVVRVRQVESGDDVLVSAHESIREMAVHDLTGSVQHAGVDVGAVGQKAAHPFGMDIDAPERRKKIPISKTQQHVAKTSRIEHVGVEQGRRTGHYLLQVEFLVACGQTVERLTAAELGFATPCKNVLGADAAVRADLPTGDPPFVE